MLRVIFDTNIYGLLLQERDIFLLEEKIEQDKEFVVYGFSLIRKELRDIPKAIKFGKSNQRNLILSLYDRLTHGRYLSESIKIDRLALKYYNVYRLYGGIHTWHEMRVDFTLVACATYYNLDIVYSEDKKTLASKTALKAYKHVNSQDNFRTPTFFTYSDLLLKFDIKKPNGGKNVL